MATNFPNKQWIWKHNIASTARVYFVSPPYPSPCHHLPGMAQQPRIHKPWQFYVRHLLPWSTRHRWSWKRGKISMKWRDETPRRKCRLKAEKGESVNILVYKFMNISYRCIYCKWFDVNILCMSTANSYTHKVRIAFGLQREILPLSMRILCFWRFKTGKFGYNRMFQQMISRQSLWWLQYITEPDLIKNQAENNLWSLMKVCDVNSVGDFLVFPDCLGSSMNIARWLQYLGRSFQLAQGDEISGSLNNFGDWIRVA